ncbi:thiamine-phosphate kinase [Candidatus Thorarchaeota archaeon]|nr:MAG: thiamine-phosphate kinase [Candidatus Thorarchaeota archaeon]
MDSEIGSERSFLQNIRHLIQKPVGAVLGFDDDASDLPIVPKTSVVVNVDTFVRETDWLPGMTAAQVGYKTAVMAVSDIVAKGAAPQGLMLSLCFPQDYSREEATEIVRGYSQYGLKNGIPFLGGDLGCAEDVVLTGVAIGTASPSRIISRGGTKKGDIIATTGLFGLTAVAYEHLIRGQELDSGLREAALVAAYKPQIYHHFVAALAESEAVTASMDSSDGLGITLHTMAEQCELAFVIDRLPIPPDVLRFAEENNLDEMRLVMGGGEEFILVVTIPDEKWDMALDIAKKQRVPLREIGRAQKGEGVVYESSEGVIEVPRLGYDSLTRWDSSSE